MIEVVIEEMVGSDWVPDRNDCERAFGWKAKPSTRAKWRSSPSAGSCVPITYLTEPTLLEMAILWRLRPRTLIARRFRGRWLQSVSVGCPIYL